MRAEAEARRTARRNGDDDDAVVAELAKLSAADYDRRRKSEAERLGITVPTLNKLVSEARGKNGSAKRDEKNAERPSPFPEIEPWPSPVNGAELLTEIDTAIREFVILPSRGAAVALALWALHTHCFRYFCFSPRLAVTSPTMRCGKTRVLDVIAALVPRPMRAASISESVLFRVIEEHAPTVLFDETDRALAERRELIGLIDAGHSPGTCAWRNVGEGAAMRLAAFRVFAPLALAGIGRLPAPIADRSLRIEMQRKRPSETVARLDRDAKAALATLARKAARWAADNAERLQGARPEIMAGLDDRAADSAEPLLAIADAADGPWPARARAALLALAGASSADEDDGSVRLLWDVAAIFDAESAAAAALTSMEIVERLLAADESPWREAGKGGKPLTAAQLARRLARLHIAPEQFRDEAGKQHRGYVRTRFDDVLARYPAPQSVTVSQVQQNQAQMHFSKCNSGKACDTFESVTNADEIGVCDTVTLPKPESEGEA